MYIQLDNENRIVGLSQEKNKAFPYKVNDEDVPEDFDNYLFIDDRFIFNEREENKFYREEMEKQAAIQELPEMTDSIMDAVIELASMFADFSNKQKNEGE